MEKLHSLNGRRALVLFSGGQDSTICLAYALSHYDYVETIGFDYGQRNRVELDCRTDVILRIMATFPEWGSKLGPDRLLDLSTFSSLSKSALTDEMQSISMDERGLPTTFLPGRNLFFFHYAAVIAYNRDMGTLVGGMCETDYSGYPDCREETLRHLETTLNLGMGTNFKIVTPLMLKNKAQSWEMAHQLGGEGLISIIREASHTCYEGVRDQLHEWGYGCSKCPACVLRKKGYEEWQVDAVSS